MEEGYTPAVWMKDKERGLVVLLRGVCRDLHPLSYQHLGAQEHSSQQGGRKGHGKTTGPQCPPPPLLGVQYHSPPPASLDESEDEGTKEEEEVRTCLRWTRTACKH